MMSAAPRWWAAGVWSLSGPPTVPIKSTFATWSHHENLLREPPSAATSTTDNDFDLRQSRIWHTPLTLSSLGSYGHGAAPKHREGFQKDKLTDLRKRKRWPTAILRYNNMHSMGFSWWPNSAGWLGGRIWREVMLRRRSLRTILTLSYDPTWTDLGALCL